MMIARTTMARVYDVSSQQAYILAQEAGVLYGWKWSASGGACPTCSALHGTVFPPDADTYRHPNCTCRKVPISNSNPQAGTPYGTRVDPLPDAPPLSSVKLMESDSGWRTWSTAKGAKGPGPKNVGGKTGPRPGKKITPDPRGEIVGRGSYKDVSGQIIQGRKYADGSYEASMGGKTYRYNKDAKRWIDPEGLIADPETARKLSWAMQSSVKVTKKPAPKPKPKPKKKPAPKPEPAPVAQKAGRAPDPKIQAAQAEAREKISSGPIGRTSDFPAAQKALQEAQARQRKTRAEYEEAWSNYRLSITEPDDVRRPLMEIVDEKRKANSEALAEITQAKKRIEKTFDLDSAEAARAAVQEVGAVARKEVERRLNVWMGENPDAPLALFRDQRRRIYRDVVEEHRSVTKGGDPPLNFEKVPGMSQMPKKYQGAIKDSFELYPDEWQQAFLETFPDLRIGKVGRGYFSEQQKTIGLSYQPRKVIGPNTQRAIDELGFDPGSVEEQLTRVGVHEFGHGMERAVPGLLEMEHAWWLRRAGSNPKMRKKDGAYEVSAPEIPTPEWYTLKKYTKGPELDRAYEIFTTGVEQVLGDGGQIYLDDDLIDFVLGSLLTL
jgi:hypothetical protein